MNRDGHESVTFFTGIEIEKTPAFGKKTLFVVGVQPFEHVQDVAVATKCQHIYFGANMSFPKIGINDADAWREWEGMIMPLLKQGYLCSLDIDSTCAEGLVEGGLCEFNNFIPMISVKLPYIQLLGYNATIKLDDIDFAKTNPGVWCHSLHELRDRKVFTNWSEYTKDEPIK
jgi:hypothetical protein